MARHPAVGDRRLPGMASPRPRPAAGGAGGNGRIPEPTKTPSDAGSTNAASAARSPMRRRPTCSPHGGSIATGLASTPAPKSVSARTLSNGVSSRNATAQQGGAASPASCLFVATTPTIPGTEADRMRRVESRSQVPKVREGTADYRRPARARNNVDIPSYLHVPS